MRRRWRGAVPLGVAVFVLCLCWQPVPAVAGGALYAVPSEPPSEKQSVDFANAINQRVRPLPPSLDPPTAETPAEVEARIRTLERGVVIAGGGKRSNQKDQSDQKDRKDRPGRGEADSAPTHVATAAPVGPVEKPGDRAPLNLAFVAAGILALVGVLLGAGRKLSGPTEPA